MTTTTAREPRRINSVSELDPVTRRLAMRLVSRADDAIHRYEPRCNVIIIETYRPPDRQAWLYAKGRTQPGKIVTAARPGESVHELRRAFDVVIVREGGGAWWDAPRHLWDAIGAIGESLGLEWGGRWELADLGHFQRMTVTRDEARLIDFARVTLGHARSVAEILDEVPE